MTTKATRRHLLRRTRNELGGTRYYAACGASGIISRDYSANVTRTRDGRTVQVVTCEKCLSTLEKGPKRESKTDR